MSHIVLRPGDIAAEVVAGASRPVAMDVGAPVVSGFLLRLTSSIVATVTLWGARPNVTACPFCAGRQSEVDGMGMVVIGT